jgi:GNAT superfamily N-acetyltransferase
VIRPFERGDAEAAGALLTANSPWFWTAAGLLHRLDTLPERARRATWVAEDAGAIVGYAEAELDWATAADDVGTLYGLVAPARRGAGLGSALVAGAEEHLLSQGARELRTWSLPDDAAFLERRGYARAREERLSAVDPRTVDTSAVDDLPPGVRILPLGELDEGRLPDVYAVYVEADADVPADHPETNLPYDAWLAERVADPDLSGEASVVVLVDDAVAALSWVKVDPVAGLGEQDLTGTARAFRRRGLARLAKLAVLRFAAANGVSRVSTGNDAENAAMLSLNDSLGFRPFTVEIEWVKQVS